MKNLLPRIVAPILLILSLCAHSPIANAEILSYFDEDGRKRYVDSIEKVPEKFRDQAAQSKPPPPINKLPDYRSPLAGVSTPTATPGSFWDRLWGSPKPAAPRGAAGIEIFVTSWCPHCKELEMYLEGRKLKFKRYDIERSSEGRRIHKELGGGGIPVTRINGEKVIRGFSARTLDAALP
jgi:glutaredoxin